MNRKPDKMPTRQERECFIDDGKLASQDAANNKLFTGETEHKNTFMTF